MTMFEGKGFEVKENTSKPGKSIKPGITQAVITNVVYGETPQNKTPYIQFTHETKPVEGLVDENNNTIGQRAQTTMWMSDKSWDVAGAMWCTKAKLSLMADKLGVREQFDAISAPSAEAFVNEVAKIFTGKKARWVFGGKESQFTNSNGEEITFIRPHLNTFGFVENLNEVPNDEDTKLKFNEEKSIERLEVADEVTQDSEPNATDTSTGSPW